MFSLLFGEGIHTNGEAREHPNSTNTEEATSWWLWIYYSSGQGSYILNSTRGLNFSTYQMMHDNMYIYIYIFGIELLYDNLYFTFFFVPLA